MKLTNKITKVNDSYTVNMYDNGFMVEFSGRNVNGDWVTSKTMCNTIDDVIQVVREIAELPREE